MTNESGEGPEFRTVPKQMPDAIGTERRVQKPYPLKIDVDGAERKVLAGGEKTLSDYSMIIIETGIGTLVEQAQIIQQAGFQLFDVADICYYGDKFVPADLIFLSREFIEEYGLQVYKVGFDINKWSPHRPH